MSHCNFKLKIQHKNVKKIGSNSTKFEDAGSNMSTNKVTRVILREGEAMVLEEEKDTNVNSNKEEDTDLNNMKNGF